MNRIIGKSWRDSASLIVLSKRGRESLSRHKQAGVNYEVLLQTRTSKTSFPNSVVFPGGLYEASDASTDWLDLLRSFGYTNKDFDALHHVGDAVTPIFQPDPAKRHVALRITAIRETFEELGLLLCSRLHKSNRGSFGVHAVTDVNVKHWQEKVSKNPEELLNLCKEYNCYPDIWSLHYWSNWLTPASIPRRFNTAFFVTAFESEPPEVLSNSEVVSVQWSSPSEVLDQNNRKEVELYPPQVYELNRFLHFEDIEKFIAFAQERSCHSNEVLFPVVIKTKDGKLHVLPGDDIYPSDVDFDNDFIQEYKDKTIPELRESSTCLHRFEITYGNPTAFFVLQNYKPLNHINMDNKVIKTTVTIPKNKK